MTTIHDLPLKDQPDGQDEIELQESGGGSSRRVSIASALGAGLPVVTPVVHLGSAVGGIRLEAVSLSRVQLVQGGTPVLLIDSNGSWLSGWSADDWRIQRQTWPGTPVYASAGVVDSGLGFPAANTVGIAAGGVEVARFVTAPDAVNFLTVQPSATGEPVDVAPDGPNANIPLRVRGKGGGKVRMGPVTAAADPSAFVADKILELEDEDGNPCFVPCSTSRF